MMTTLNYCTLTTPSIHLAALSFLINWNEKRCSESNILTMDHKLVLENSSSAPVYTLQITITYWCRIQQFLGGAGFSMNAVKRKTIVQLGSLGRHCKPSPVGSRGKTLEIFGYFAFWIAQNIALLALRQGTLTKAYTRNQHFWAFGGLSLGSQTRIPASK